MHVYSAYSVPYLEFNGFIIDLDGPESEIHADGRYVIICETVVSKPQ